MQNKFLWTSVLTLALIASGVLFNTESEAAIPEKQSKTLNQPRVANGPKAAVVSRALADTSGSGWVCCNFYCLDGAGSNSGASGQCSIPGTDAGSDNLTNCQNTCKNYCGESGCDLNPNKTKVFVYSTTQNCGIDPQPSDCGIPTCLSVNN